MFSLCIFFQSTDPCKSSSPASAFCRWRCWAPLFKATQGHPWDKNLVSIKFCPSSPHSTALSSFLKEPWLGGWGKSGWPEVEEVWTEKPDFIYGQPAQAECLWLSRTPVICFSYCSVCSVLPLSVWTDQYRGWCVMDESNYRRMRAGWGYIVPWSRFQKWGSCTPSPSIVSLQQLRLEDKHRPRYPDEWWCCRLCLGNWCFTWGLGPWLSHLCLS